MISNNLQIGYLALVRALLFILCVCIGGDYDYDEDEEEEYDEEEYDHEVREDYVDGSDENEADEVHNEDL